jgi:predicted DNA-binding protein (UPF0251 family)
MSPRNKKIRKVLNPPIIKGFKPYGPDLKESKGEPVLLHYEEYEAIKLCDYDMHNHHQASVIMGVSRPTFTRIYASVRQKIAKAFVEGLQITIEGGKVYFDSDWYRCKGCKCYFNNPQKDIDITSCPLCKSNSIETCNMDHNCLHSEIEQCDEYCVCPNCRHESKHINKVPCRSELCPMCGTKMIRK